MSLITREPSAAQSAASQANGRHSRGPSSERGKAISSRNLPQPYPFSEVVARSMEVLGERPEDFEQVHKALVEAMEPRDGWESAWVQDIAILRWRLERMQRAEVAVLAVRKRKLAGERKRESMPASGAAALGQRAQIPLVGFTGLPDSPWKFQQVLGYLHQLRDVVRAGMFEKEWEVYFQALYGKNPGALGGTLLGRFQGLEKRSAEGKLREDDDAQIALIADVNHEIDDYKQKKALYKAEHLANDPVRDDSDLLLPSQQLDEVIRYETHLEDQVERKLRQFYARRREPVLRQGERLTPASEEPATGELVCQTTSAAA
ncbi:MAG: hypothetical protein ABSF71_05580 [Terriglobia bacterium]